MKSKNVIKKRIKIQKSEDIKDEEKLEIIEKKMDNINSHDEKNKKTMDITKLKSDINRKNEEIIEERENNINSKNENKENGEIKEQKGDALITEKKKKKTKKRN